MSHRLVFVAAPNSPARQGSPENADRPELAGSRLTRM